MKYSPLILCSIILSSSLLTACGGSSGSDSTETPIETTDPATDPITDPEATQLVINEIVASATDGGNDWIELYALQGDIELADYTIVDDSSEHTPQLLPDIVLAEGDFVVIQAISEDDTPPETGYYVTFKLGGDDAVTLYKDDDIVYQLDWEDGDAEEGYSFGLYLDGTGTAQTLSPTPGEANEIAQDEVVLDSILNEAAAIRINEVVAKDDAEGEDWIELYVSGSDAVNLANYWISDENNQLVNLPEITLLSGQFYKIYATTDNVENADSIPFKLGSSDTVSLFNGDDLIDQLSWKKGQALIGYSFGRFPDGSDSTSVLTPSPLMANSTALHGPLVINEIMADDINGGYDWFELFNNGIANINLAQYQVIDESDDIAPINLPDVVLAPGDYITIFATTEDINDYSVTFKLGKTDELSLILDDETVDYIEWDDSDVIAGFSYGLYKPDNWNNKFLSPSQNSENKLASAFKPTEVQNLFIDITNENWQDILANPLDEEYHDASITLNGVTLDSVAFRTKGGSSLSSVARSNSNRYSFKIDINKYVDGQKFFGLKKFTLQNSFNDPSYMREVIAYQLLEEMGVATPQNSYVNVYVNGDLFGLYLMVEAIDGEFLENNFANANGDLYKPDGTGSDLQWINDDISSYSGINLQTNEETTDNGAFLHFVEQLDQGATDIIDVDALLRYLAVSVSLSNLDSYQGALAHNYYIYDQDGVFTLLPWDFNESFGTFNMGCQRDDVRGLYIDEPTSGSLYERPLIANVFAQQHYLDIYHDYLWQLIDGPLEENAFNQRIYDIAELISEHVANDPSSFYGYDAFEDNLDSTISNFFGLTEFMSYRVDNMTKQLEGTLPSAGVGRGYCY